MASDDLPHRVRVPEPLEALIAQLQQLRLAFGSDEADLIAAADADLRQAMAARDRGDRPEAVRLISSGMDRLAHLADRMDQAAGHAMRHVIAQFRAAVLRGQTADAQQAADVMREMSGAAIIDPDANEEDGGSDEGGG